MPLPDKSFFPDTLLGYFGLHEIILYLVIALLASALGGGPALKALFNTVLRLFGHGASETIINIGAQDRAAMKGYQTDLAGYQDDMARARKDMAGDRSHDRAAMDIVQAILSGKACLVSDACTKCGEERARSLRNENDIAGLVKVQRDDRVVFWKELKGIRRGITCITNGLLAKQIISPQDIPKED